MILGAIPQLAGQAGTWVTKARSHGVSLKAGKRKLSQRGAGRRGEEIGNLTSRMAH